MVFGHSTWFMETLAYSLTKQDLIKADGLPSGLGPDGIWGLGYEESRPASALALPASTVAGMGAYAPGGTVGSCRG